MGQSAYIYRVSKENFEILRKSTDRQEFRLSALALEYWEFQGSFMGIEFILAKNQDEDTKQLLFEIFYPPDSLGEEELENMTEQEQYDFFESGKHIPFLDSLKITKINKIIQNLVTIQ